MNIDRYTAGGHMATTRKEEKKMLVARYYFFGQTSGNDVQYKVLKLMNLNKQSPIQGQSCGGKRSSVKGAKTPGAPPQSRGTTDVPVTSQQGLEREMRKLSTCTTARRQNVVRRAAEDL